MNAQETPFQSLAGECMVVDVHNAPGRRGKQGRGTGQKSNYRFLRFAPVGMTMLCPDRNIKAGSDAPGLSQSLETSTT